MSEETDSFTNAHTIYIPLLNEGTFVIRPTLGIKIGENIYKILPTKDYDPKNEEWEFPPGSTVTCVVEKRNSHEVLVAKAKLT
jgi:hypothetical protein